MPADAQVLPPGTNLATVTPPTNTTVWNLLGDAVLFDPALSSTALTMPPGTPGLTINSSGSTITLNDGLGHFGFFSGGPANLTLSGVTLAGGSEANGGAIAATDVFVLNASGPVTITGNSATGQGGAISAGGNLTLNAVGGDITFDGNSENAAPSVTGPAPEANAIWFSKNNTPTFTLNAAAGNTITFFDPAQGLRGMLNVVVQGSGTVVFDGSHHAALNDRWSQLYADTSVASGATMVVQNDAVYGLTLQDELNLLTPILGRVGAIIALSPRPSSYTLNPGATLMGGVAGTVNANQININGTLNIAGTTPGTFSTFTLKVATQDAQGGNAPMTADRSPSAPAAEFFTTLS